MTFGCWPVAAALALGACEPFVAVSDFPASCCLRPLAVETAVLDEAADCIVRSIGSPADDSDVGALAFDTAVAGLMRLCSRPCGLSTPAMCNGGTTTT